ncbi:hypothetical protein KOW79_016976 [Hemibagrus wyckioides]|uniref:Uncharacterized protein n=1 Tax=Hemibagrus wyckioides TaxID=337641 RepID=A0A9D3SHP6_9TELE|nr:hypothetical protein KOW79_016976 [Hemibagrus wyckioides]
MARQTEGGLQGLKALREKEDGSERKKDNPNMSQQNATPQPQQQYTSINPTLQDVRDTDADVRLPEEAQARHGDGVDVNSDKNVWF